MVLEGFDLDNLATAITDNKSEVILDRALTENFHVLLGKFHDIFKRPMGGRGHAGGGGDRRGGG